MSRDNDRRKAPQFGDFVSYDFGGFPKAYGYVIGTPTYSHRGAGSVVVVAAHGVIGMPLHEGYCTVIGRHQYEIAEPMRRRYIDAHGDNFHGERIHGRVQ